MTETSTPNANVPPAVIARYLRCAVAAQTAAGAGAREDAAYEARHVAAQAGIDETALEAAVLAEIAKIAKREAPVELAATRTYANSPDGERIHLTTHYAADLTHCARVVGDTWYRMTDWAPVPGGRTLCLVCLRAERKYTEAAAHMTRVAHEPIARAAVAAELAARRTADVESEVHPRSYGPGNYVDPTPDPIVDRVTAPAELDDRALWVQFMAEDREMGYGVPDDDRHGALIAEIARRFGADATELTADYSIALHMSSDDLVTWASEQHEHLIGIATGRIVPEWRREDEANASHGASLEGDIADILTRHPAVAAKLERADQLAENEAAATRRERTR